MWEPSPTPSFRCSLGWLSLRKVLHQRPSGPWRPEVWTPWPFPEPACFEACPTSYCGLRMLLSPDLIFICTLFPPHLAC